MSEYKNKTITKRQLQTFNFRFLKEVEDYDNLYRVIDAREYSKQVNARKPHVIDNTHIAFWTNEGDHAETIELKNILPF